MTLTELLAEHPRLLISGVPKAGKTTLCLDVTDRPVYHTDDYKHHPWDDAPRHLADAVRGSAWVVEGIRALAVLRHGVEADAAVWLPTPLATYTPGQARFADTRRAAFERWAADPPIPVYVYATLDALELGSRPTA